MGDWRLVIGHSSDATSVVVRSELGCCLSADYSGLHLYFVAFVELFG